MALPAIAPSKPFRAVETLSSNFGGVVAGTGCMVRQGVIAGRLETSG
jgi:hypothetical protein